MDVKKTGQEVLKWTVVGGSAVIAVGAVMQLTKSTNLKSAIMPLVTLLVGVSAFSYAMTAEKVGFVPEIDSNKQSDGEKKSNYISCETRGGVGNTKACPSGMWCVKGVCQAKKDTQL